MTTNSDIRKFKLSRSFTGHEQDVRALCVLKNFDQSQMDHSGPYLICSSSRFFFLKNKSFIYI